MAESSGGTQFCKEICPEFGRVPRAGTPEQAAECLRRRRLLQEDVSSLEALLDKVHAMIKDCAGRLGEEHCEVCLTLLQWAFERCRVLQVVAEDLEARDGHSRFIKAASVDYATISLGIVCAQDRATQLTRNVELVEPLALPPVASSKVIKADIAERKKAEPSLGLSDLADLPLAAVEFAASGLAELQMPDLKVPNTLDDLVPRELASEVAQFALAGSEVVVSGVGQAMELPGKIWGSLFFHESSCDVGSRGVPSETAGVLLRDPRDSDSAATPTRRRR